MSQQACGKVETLLGYVSMPWIQSGKTVKTGGRDQLWFALVLVCICELPVAATTVRMLELVTKPRLQWTTAFQPQRHNLNVTCVVYMDASPLGQGTSAEEVHGHHDGGATGAEVPGGYRSRCLAVRELPDMRRHTCRHMFDSHISVLWKVDDHCFVGSQ